MSNKRLITLALAVVAGLGLLGFLLSLLFGIHDGSLSIAVNDAGATITVSQIDKPDRALGKGSRTVSLAPGDYQITAAAGDKISSTATTVKSDKTTAITLTLAALAASKEVATYSARSIFPTTTGLVFLNAPFNLLNNYHDGVADPYLEDIYPVKAVRWVTDSTAYFLDSRGQWRYWGVSGAKDLNLGGIIQDDQPNLNSTAFNERGGMAFVYKKAAYVLDNPAAKARKVADLPHSSWDIALSDSGDTMLFDTTEGADEKITRQPSRIVTTKEIQIPDLVNLTDASWAPDGAALAYAKADGIYVYDTKAATSQRVLAARPNHSSSLSWLNKNRLVFVQGDSLWLYKTDLRTSTKLTTIVGSIGSAQQITPVGEKEVLIGTDPNTSGDGGIIYRISLGN